MIAPGGAPSRAVDMAAEAELSHRKQRDLDRMFLAVGYESVILDQGFRRLVQLDVVVT